MLYGLWVSNQTAGAIAAALEHATNFLSIAQSQPSSGPLLVGHRTLAWSLIVSGDYRAALAHLETAASLYRPDEHRDFALRYGQDIGVSAACVKGFGCRRVVEACSRAEGRRPKASEEGTRGKAVNAWPTMGI